MTAADHSWSNDWTVDLRVWVERHGKAILGKGRLELLEAIDRCRSISAAARQLGMSYRHAWVLTQSINDAAGETLIETATGGSRGGGARLTPRGLLAVQVFRDLQAHLQAAAATLLPRLVAPTAADASIHVAAAVSLEEVLSQLLTEYALRQPAVSVRAVFGASNELADHLLAGAPGDLFLSADPSHLERLATARLVDPGPWTLLAENSLAAIGLADRDLPVHKPADLLISEVTRIALAEPASPLGGYTRTYLRGLGLYEAVLARSVQVDHAHAVVAAVHGGRAEVGMVYGSDALTVSGCRTLFRVRRKGHSIRYVGAVVQRGQQVNQARTLLAFLASSAAQRCFRRCGFVPVSQSLPR